ncbi:hypothetical protein [Clostridioides difficile]
MPFDPETGKGVRVRYVYWGFFIYYSTLLVHSTWFLMFSYYIYTFN